MLAYWNLLWKERCTHKDIHCPSEVESTVFHEVYNHLRSSGVEELHSSVLATVLHQFNGANNLCEDSNMLSVLLPAPAVSALHFYSIIW